MNKKGQSLIIFVLLLPLIVLILAFIIDSSLCLMRKNQIDGVITSNMQVSLERNIQDIEKIQKTINKNIDVDIKIEVIDKNLIITGNGKIKSIFAKIFDFSWYKYNFNYSGNYITKKINKK